MKSTDVQIVPVKVRELVSFAEGARAARSSASSLTPISKVRAAAQAKNPHAEPDDVGLLAAYAGGACVGFLGLVPSYVRVDGRLSKMSWLSTWYISPEQRHLAAGAKLMLHAIKTARELAVTGFSAATASIYQGLKFKPLGPLSIHSLHVNRWNLLAAPLLALSRRRVREQESRLLGRALDVARVPGRSLLYAALDASLRGGARGFDVDVRDHGAAFAVDDAREDGPSPVRFYRGTAAIRWTVDEPWTVRDAKEATPGYYFSDVAREWKYASISVRSGASSHGSLLLCIAERGDTRQASVLDDHVHGADAKRAALAAVLRVAGRERADLVFFPPAYGAIAAAHPLLARLFHRDERAYFVFGKTLTAVAPRLTLTLADGDVAFA